MTRFRFSLLSLVGGTAAIAVVCAALVGASKWLADLTWAGAFFGLTFTLLCAMLVAPSRRGFWTGFSLFGWMYVVLTCSPLADRPNVPSLLPLLRQAAEALPQAKSAPVSEAELMYAVAVDRFPFDLAASQGMQDSSAALATSYLNQTQSLAKRDFIESFVRISQAFIALLVGFIGGVMGHFIRQRSHSATTG